MLHLGEINKIIQQEPTSNQIMVLIREDCRTAQQLEVISKITHQPVSKAIVPLLSKTIPQTLNKVIILLLSRAIVPLLNKTMPQILSKIIPQTLSKMKPLEEPQTSKLILLQQVSITSHLITPLQLVPTQLKRLHPQQITKRQLIATVVLQPLHKEIRLLEMPTIGLIEMLLRIPQVGVMVETII